MQACSKTLQHSACAALPSCERLRPMKQRPAGMVLRTSARARATSWTTCCNMHGP